MFIRAYKYAYVKVFLPIFTLTGIIRSRPDKTSILRKLDGLRAGPKRRVYKKIGRFVHLLVPILIPPVLTGGWKQPTKSGRLSLNPAMPPVLTGGSLLFRKQSLADALCHYV